MVDWTDRHCLYLFHLLVPQATLYTEMIVDKAIIFGNSKQLLQHDVRNQPVILQLGGSNLREMAAAVKIAEDYSYTGYNINVGCPSKRVKAGAFGACLMETPEIVAECFKAMAQETSKPISIKTRLGIDDQDSQEFLYRFIEITAKAGCKEFTIHARKALLDGLSPKQNREVPPLQYERVYQLKQDFPELHITINGGINTLEGAEAHIKKVDAVMIGRLAYKKPYEFAKLAHQLNSVLQLGQKHKLLSRQEVLEYYRNYILANQDVPVSILIKSLVGLFYGEPNAKQWRKLLNGKHDHAAITAILSKYTNKA